MPSFLFIWSQSTGCQSAGKEVNEGDIIYFDNEEIGGNKGYGEVVYCDDLTIVNHPGFVLFNNGFICRDELMSTRIVGNKFENPELLEKP